MTLVDAYALDPDTPSPSAEGKTPAAIKPVLKAAMLEWLAPYTSTADQIGMVTDLLALVEAHDPGEDITTWGDTRWCAQTVQHGIHFLYYLMGLKMCSDELGFDPYNLSNQQRGDMFNLLRQIHGAGARLASLGVPDELIP